MLLLLLIGASAGAAPVATGGRVHGLPVKKQRREVDRGADTLYLEDEEVLLLMLAQAMDEAEN
jgi:hypothetical protein